MHLSAPVYGGVVEEYGAAFDGGADEGALFHPFPQAAVRICGEEGGEGGGSEGEGEGEGEGVDEVPPQPPPSVMIY